MCIRQRLALNLNTLELTGQDKIRRLNLPRMPSRCSGNLKTFNSLHKTSGQIRTTISNQLSLGRSTPCRIIWCRETTFPTNNKAWTSPNSNNMTRVKWPPLYTSNSTSRQNLTKRSVSNRLKIRWSPVLNFSKYPEADSLNQLRRELLEGLGYSSLLTVLSTSGMITRLKSLKATLVRVHKGSSPLFAYPQNNNPACRIPQLRLITELISPVKRLLTCLTFNQF